MEKVNLSVVVASYNYEKLISECLNSLISQTDKQFEIVVVDDGSKDNSLRILREYEDKYENVKLYTHPNEENRGLSETLKLGISRANGEYVAFCESDDTWDCNHVKYLKSYINENPQALILCNEINIVNNSSYKAHEYWCRRCQNFLIVNSGKNIFYREIFENVIPTFSALCVKKELFDNVDFNTPIPKYIDYWIYRQITPYNNVFFVEKALTNWLKHDGSYDSNAKKENLTDFFIKSNELLISKDRELSKNKKTLFGLMQQNELIAKNFGFKIEKNYCYNSLPLDKTSMPLVSCIVPVYNVEKYIKRAIDSLLNQTYPNVEILVIDDKTPDSSIALIRQIDNPKIKIVSHSKNQGLGAARNTGINYARGKYVCFLDSDDSLSSNFIEQLVIAAESTRADVVMAEINLIKKGRAEKLGNMAGLCVSYLEKISVLPNGAAWNKLYSRDFLIKNNIKFPEGVYWEDNIFTFQAMYYANYLVLIEDAFYNYCIREGSITTSKEKLEKLKHDSLIIGNDIINFVDGKINTHEEWNVVFSFMRKNFINKGWYCDPEYKIKAETLLMQKKSMVLDSVNQYSPRRAIGSSLKLFKYKLLSVVCIGKMKKKYKLKYNNYKKNILT